MAEKREFSITRTRNGFKPRISDNDLPFYQDANGDVTVGLGGANDIFYSGSGSTVVAEMPYMYLGEEDGGLPERQQILTEDDLPEGVELDYRIDGGFNNNCIVVDWTIKNKDLYQVDWVALKTFTGMQMKYVLPKKFPPLYFALAREDAYVYCNKQPCEECAFRCKSGFVIYYHIKGLGIVRKPMTRISLLKLEK
ncbi:hypothetical protein [Slackia heliotrinireducens]|uniref:hypothetical protein n=1 Tax=Slackia heliotrinireducens TaxID=84110 RepID=UPI0033152172